MEARQDQADMVHTSKGERARGGQLGGPPVDEGSPVAPSGDGREMRPDSWTRKGSGKGFTRVSKGLGWVGVGFFDAFFEAKRLFKMANPDAITDSLLDRKRERERSPCFQGKDCCPSFGPGCLELGRHGTKT